MDGRANPVMDQKVVGVVLLEVVQWSRQYLNQLLDAAWSTAALAVVVV